MQQHAGGVVAAGVESVTTGNRACATSRSADATGCRRRLEAPAEGLPAQGADMEIVNDIDRVVIVDEIEMERGRVEERRAQGQRKADPDLPRIIFGDHAESVAEPKRI